MRKREKKWRTEIEYQGSAEDRKQYLWQKKAKTGYGRREIGMRCRGNSHRMHITIKQT